MKACPFCFEEIQDEALKCKHCGEWLNKKPSSDIVNKIGSLFKSGAAYLEEQKQKRHINRYKHLFTPTNDNPLIYNENKLFASYFKSGDERIELDEINGIVYHSAAQAYNGMVSQKKIKFKILYSLGDRTSLNPPNTKEIVIVNSTLFPIANKKEIEIIELMCQMIKQMTLKTRLMRYINEVNQKGYFEYDLKLIHNNGDLTYANKTVNIKTAYENGLVSFGSHFKSIRSSSIDPFVFIIYPSTGVKVRVFGLDLSSKVEIQCVNNKDCFDGIIEQIVTNGFIVP